MLRARADLDADSMVALWMIGYEDEPERSAEICICEICGSDVTADTARIGMGVHPFGDPSIVDDFEQVDVPIDVRQFHEYAAVWTPAGVTFHVDGVQVRTVDQSPDYSMQFMLGIYDFTPLPVAETSPPRSGSSSTRSERSELPRSQRSSNFARERHRISTVNPWAPHANQPLVTLARARCPPRILVARR